MVYAPDGRQRFVTPDVQDRAYDQVGDALGLVLVDSSAVGSWEGRFVGRRMEVRLQSYDRISARVDEAVKGRMQEIAELFGARALSFR